MKKFLILVLALSFELCADNNVSIEQEKCLKSNEFNQFFIDIGKELADKNCSNKKNETCKSINKRKKFQEQCLRENIDIQVATEYMSKCANNMKESDEQECQNLLKNIKNSTSLNSVTTHPTIVYEKKVYYDSISQTDDNVFIIRLKKRDAEIPLLGFIQDRNTTYLKVTSSNPEEFFNQMGFTSMEYENAPIITPHTRMPEYVLNSDTDRIKSQVIPNKNLYEYYHTRSKENHNLKLDANNTFTLATPNSDRSKILLEYWTEKNKKYYIQPQCIGLLTALHRDNLTNMTKLSLDDEPTNILKIPCRRGLVIKNHQGQEDYFKKIFENKEKLVGLCKNKSFPLHQGTFNGKALFSGKKCKDIKEDELKEITSIVLNNVNLSDIRFLSYFKHLRTLDLRHNHISNLEPLKSLRYLTKLYLSDNDIGDVKALKGLKNLTTLYLDFNKIENISPLIYLQNLKILNLNHNNLNIINPKMIQSSQKIVDKNAYTLGKLVNLRDLYLENTGLKRTPDLCNLTKLFYLSLVRNEALEDISSFQKCKHKVNSLDLPKNLKVQCPNGKKQCIEIGKFEYTIDGLRSLCTNLTTFGETLKLAVDQIGKKCTNFTYDDLEKQTELNLINKRIKDIRPLRYFKNLTKLRLSHNNIEDIRVLEALKKLELLYVDHNQIKNIEALSTLSNLKYLKLTDNKIEDISSLRTLSNLTDIYLKDNNITLFPQSLCKPSLFYIEIDKVTIECTLEYMNKRR